MRGGRGRLQFRLALTRLLACRARAIRLLLAAAFGGWTTLLGVAFAPRTVGAIFTATPTATAGRVFRDLGLVVFSAARRTRISVPFGRLFLMGNVR